MTVTTAALIISILSLAVAMASVLTANRRIRVAEHNNLITGTNPWVSVLLKYVDLTITHAQKHRETYEQICVNPFVDAAAKSKRIGELGDARDAAFQSLHTLVQLAPKAEPLRALLSEMVSHDDSFFHNNDLSMSEQVAKQILCRYRQSADRFMVGLRDFATKRENF